MLLAVMHSTGSNLRYQSYIRNLWKRGFVASFDGHGLIIYRSRKWGGGGSLGAIFGVKFRY